MTVSRRQFLSLAGACTAGLYSSPLLANVDSKDTEDYKALVCIFLYGGNDSHNMILPLDSGNRYDLYATSRRHLAVKNKPHTIASAFGTGSVEQHYQKGIIELGEGNIGINSLMPELAFLSQQNQATAILNTGALAEPVSREQLHRDKQKLPLFLFAHNHQQRIAQTANPHELNSTGWAGRLADLNQSSNGLATNISYGGNHRLQQGAETTPLILKPGRIPKVFGMEHKNIKGNRDRQALYEEMVKSDAAMSSWHKMYAGKLNNAITEFDQIREIWDNTNITYKSKTLTGSRLFELPKKGFGFDQSLKGKLMQQLEAVAKMIQLNANRALKDKSNHRQVYMVTLGGFDTHADQNTRHPALLRELSLAVESFQLALNEVGLGKRVRTFTSSEFNRTLSINGDGTDHAWGGHQWIFGEGLTENSIGELPSYELDGEDDFGNKGRFIPSLSQDQTHASLCKWFGAETNQLDGLFPHLRNFSKDRMLEQTLFKSIT